LRQGKSGRSVYVPCIERLRTLLDELRTSGSSTSAYILTTEQDRPWRKRHFSRLFKATCDRAGIPRELTFHDLRGTAVTMLAESGCTEAEIASITGDSRRSVSAILEKYTARTTSQSTRAMERLEHYLRTRSANRLQTVASLFAPGGGKGDVSA
jgi:integrase